LIATNINGIIKITGKEQKNQLGLLCKEEN